MTIHFSTIKRVFRGALRLLLLTTLVSTVPMFAAGKDTPHHEHSNSTLVQLVRQATAQYKDVNKAIGAGYAQLLGCMSGSDHGSMGVHYLNSNYMNDGLINVNQPEALMYEPINGKLELVGAEYIVDAATWLATNPGAPVLENQTFLYVDSPNRFNIPAFFELHVWAWRDNPQGSFVDWNNAVTCEHE